ncbi:hypothetical protein VA7868_03455 [Vibrio aerogenes CECT 7868]|uniref:Uncharacterized protein n=1 Tax=Vibrio aerogenes CECT 7868 TaxID=1216006 RepID=A0A1M6A2L8_9VIBR|nr:hypothetical protein [Vibrio aerogenes]SHI30747.1 hypothetical protein VA7868_03455 [Vibrio aerogenes CECT 7868]
MLTFVIAAVVVLIFFYINRNEAVEVQSYLAIGLMASYLALLVFVPPHSAMNAMYIGNLFGVLSLVSFGMILFPELNRFTPENITRVLGWAGLIGMSLLLCIYKLFVWQ